MQRNQKFRETYQWSHVDRACLCMRFGLTWDFVVSRWVDRESGPSVQATLLCAGWFMKEGLTFEWATQTCLFPPCYKRFYWAVNVFLSQVVFEGVVGRSFTSDIAIDDVSIAPGACGANQGGCNFEIDTCTWSNVPGDQFDWIRLAGSTPTTFTGPSNDHTQGDTSGMCPVQSSQVKHFNCRTRTSGMCVWVNGMPPWFTLKEPPCSCYRLLSFWFLVS
jgi:hypothetical protein